LVLLVWEKIHKGVFRQGLKWFLRIWVTLNGCRSNIMMESKVQLFTAKDRLTKEVIFVLFHK
jgi:hypothetical protein